MTSQAQHTPGPWTVETRQTFVGPIANHIDSGWGLVATMQGGIIEDFRVDINPSVVAADARLIAAAPELLEAVKASLTRLDEQLRGSRPSLHAINEYAPMLRAAIRKATEP